MPFFMAALSPPMSQQEAHWPAEIMEAKPQSIVRSPSRPQSITISPSRADSSNSIRQRPLSLGVEFDRSFSSPSVLQRTHSTAKTSPTSRIPSPVSIDTSRPAAAFRSRPHSLLHTFSSLASRTSIAEEDELDIPPRIVVGVDWGTTYSGVAIVHSAHPDDIDVITTWPGSNSIPSEKVPSELSYDSVLARSRPASTIISSLPSPPTTPSNEIALNSSFSPPEKSIHTQIRWGFQLKPEERRLRCLKLFLDKNQTLPSYVSPLDTARQLRTHGRTVIDGAGDYLGLLYMHTMDILRRRYGVDFETYTKVEFVLTVPAVWSDAAKHATLLAAEAAGMGSRGELRLVSEPEAAAVYTLKSFLPEFIKAGDNVIICDAGGGTVDIIAYRILQLSPLQLEESLVGTGSLCGSAFINFRFEDHVRSRLGEDRYRYIRETKPKIWHTAFKHFEESVKRNFEYHSAPLRASQDLASVYDEQLHDYDSETDFSIPLPGLADDETIGLDTGFLSLSSAQVKDLFDPVVDQVLGLLQSQVNGIHVKGETVAAVILVGGFGQSRYLFTRLQAHFGGSIPPLQQLNSSQLNLLQPQLTVAQHQPANTQIEILQPPHAWTAIARGAALVGITSATVEAATPNPTLPELDTSLSTEDLNVEPQSTLMNIRPSMSVVRTRRSRAHYGTSYATMYDPNKGHLVRERYWSMLWERWMVADRMAWHVTKGQALHSERSYSRTNIPADGSSNEGAARITYTRNFVARPSPDPSISDDDPDHHPLNTMTPLIVEDELFACSTDDAPSIFDPLLCTPVCTLTTDLTQVPRIYFQKLQTRGGVLFDRLEFSLVMNFQGDGSPGIGNAGGNGSANGVLGFELWVGDQRFGGTAVKAQFH